MLIAWILKGKCHKDTPFDIEPIFNQKMRKEIGGVLLMEGKGKE
jgi:hypothetical protein